VVVFRSVILAGVAVPLIRFLSLARILGLIDRGGRRGGSSGGVGEIERVGQTVRSVVRRFPRFGVGECLVRSVVLYRLLRRIDLSNQDVALLLGAGKIASDGKPALHCWIEVSGRPIAEDANPHNEFLVVLRHPMPNTHKSQYF
jgi:hypothetical protein